MTSWKIPALKWDNHRTKWRRSILYHHARQSNLAMGTTYFIDDIHRIFIDEGYWKMKGKLAYTKEG